MPRLHSLWSWAAILAATVVYGSGAILTSWIPPRGRFFLRWARGWSRALFFLTGIPTRIEVSRAAAQAPQAVFMSNHESGVDIPLLLLAISQDVRFLAKRELFFVPFLGWSMWLGGFVPVDRRRTEKALDVFEELGDRLGKGLSVLVFPEGTRSRDGRLGPFKKSGFLLALRSEVPIVPIGISGAREVLGSRGLTVTPRLVTARVGDPIPTAGLGVSRRDELMERVRNEIVRLRGER